MTGGVKLPNRLLAYDDLASKSRLSSMPQKRSSGSKSKRSPAMPALHLGSGGNQALAQGKQKTRRDTSKLSLPRLDSQSSSEENDTKYKLGDDSNSKSETHMANPITQSSRGGPARSRPSHMLSNGVAKDDYVVTFGDKCGDVESKQDKYHPARRKEKINDWRDVKSKMKRRMFQPANQALDVKEEEPVFRRLTAEETIQVVV